MKFVALLRGINVGGNNRVSMLELKACFENLGFENVVTYINSGNIIFESSQTSIVRLVRMCESAIESQFGFHVICVVISAEELKSSLDNAPKWWGVQDDSKHNAIFVIPPKSPAEIMQEVGETKPEYEHVKAVGPIIFWTAPLKSFSRTRYSKIVGTKAYKFITIRNSNTARKLAELCE